MTNNPSDYVRYTIYSKRDQSSGDYHIPSYERDFKNIVNNAVKSALPKGAFYHIGEKQLTKSGQGRLDIYVHKDNSSVMSKSMSTMEEDLTFKGGGEKYHITRARPVTEEMDKALKELEKSKNKEDTEATRFTKGTLMKVVAILTAIATIARRILSSIMSFSQQTVKDMVTAHNLGMSYEAVRSYRHIEKAHSMKEGTITGAVSDIQNKFGNITSLDEKALEALAVVMGGKIEDMVKMGMGASNPEAVLGAILDTFNEKANAGYNSVGQYVGEAQARRELYSYLLKVSPQVADIFATMQEEQHNINSIYRYQADTFEKFKNLNITKRGGNGDVDYGVLDTLGQTWNQLLEAVNQIKEAFIVGFAPVLLPLIRRLADTRVGMTAEEKKQRNEENKLANSQALEATKKTMKYYEDQGIDNLKPEDRAYYEALKEYAEDLKQANTKRTVYYKVRTPNEVKLMGLANLEAYKEAKEAGSQKVLGVTNLITDATTDEIAEVAGAFNYDTEEARTNFRDYVDKHNKKLPKAIAKAEEEERKKEYRDNKKRAKDKVKELKSYKSSRFSEVRNKISGMHRGKFDLLIEAYETFNDDYDLSDERWQEDPNKFLFQELNRLATLGHVLKTGTGNYVADDGDHYVLSEYGKNKVAQAFPVLSTDDEALYMEWLYEENKINMSEDIRDMRLSTSKSAYMQARVGDMLNELYDTEGKLYDWRKAFDFKKLVNPATLYSVMDTSNGEKRLKFILEIKDKDGKITRQEIANILNGEGIDAMLGTVTYDTETKQPVLDVATGTPASEGE